MSQMVGMNRVKTAPLTLILSYFKINDGIGIFFTVKFEKSLFVLDARIECSVYDIFYVL